MRAIIAALLGVLVGAFFVPAHAQTFLRNDRFDEDIRRAVNLYLPGQDWRWWKAQLAAESRLDPNARSPVGAEGIAQFMRGTWAEVLPAIGLDPKVVPRSTASVAIEAGAVYMARLWRQWTGWTGTKGQDAYEASIAGYNAGSGHVLKAWRACNRPRPWDAIAVCLPQITGRHSVETRGYVVRIRSYYRALVAG
jgi:soluble lytic murein transglycosylase-like protein